MAGKLIYIRLRQLSRQLKNAWFYSFLFAGLFGFLVFQAYLAFQRTPDSWFSTGLLIVVCAGIQLQRTDTEFVYRHLENPYRELLLEYLILVFPFVLTSLFSPNWYCFPLLMVALTAVPLLKTKAKNLAYFPEISLLIPVAHFELISGIRKHFKVLFLLYAAALIFSWVKILPLLLLALITVMVVSFFQACESAQILAEGNQSPQVLLNRKLKTYAGYLTGFYLPVLILNYLFQHYHWLIYAGFLLSQIAVLSFAVLQKYRSYQPGKQLYAGSLLLTLVSFSAFVPVFMPAPVLLCLVYYINAVENLSYYLND